MKEMINTLLLCLFVGTAVMAQNLSRDDLQNGDLLFVGQRSSIRDSSSMSDAIIESTGQNGAVSYFHVAIVEVTDEGACFVIEAAPQRGVVRLPIDTFLTAYAKGESAVVIEVMRLKRNRHAAQYVAAAKGYCGEGYDYYYKHGNNLHYCSELVYDSYRRRGGKAIFSAQPMNFLSTDGTYPTYWITLFQQLGEPIPQGELGTNPHNLSRSPKLKPIGNLK